MIFSKLWAILLEILVRTDKSMKPNVKNINSQWSEVAKVWEINLLPNALQYNLLKNFSVKSSSFESFDEFQIETFDFNTFAAKV